MTLSPPTPQEELKEGIKSYLHQVLDAESQKETLSGKAARFVLEEPPDAGLQAYIRAAFLYEPNLLALAAIGGATAILATWALPLVVAAELAYLGGMVSMPKFRQAIDRQIWQRKREASHTAAPPAAPIRPLGEILKTLQPANRMRFENLKAACVDMRDIARDVRGSTTTQDSGMESLLTGDLDRLLWTFLRYLIVEEALERFAMSTDAGALEDQIAQLEERIAKAQTSGDDRLLRSLNDSLATAHARMENFQQAVRNSEFVQAELDRIEGKIRAITEMTVNRSDPGFISSQVDSVVQSMRLTEQTISELNLVTGLTDEYFEPPAILETH